MLLKTKIFPYFVSENSQPWHFEKFSNEACPAITQIGCLKALIRMSGVSPLSLLRRACHYGGWQPRPSCNQPDASVNRRLLSKNRSDATPRYVIRVCSFHWPISQWTVIHSAFSAMRGYFPNVSILFCFFFHLVFLYVKNNGARKI